MINSYEIYASTLEEFEAELALELNGELDPVFDLCRIKANEILEIFKDVSFVKQIETLMVCMENVIKAIPDSKEAPIGKEPPMAIDSVLNWADTLADSLKNAIFAQYRDSQHLAQNFKNRE